MRVIRLAISLVICTVKQYYGCNYKSNIVEAMLLFDAWNENAK